MTKTPSYQKAEWRQAWVKDADGRLAQLIVGVFRLGEHYPDRPIALESDRTPFGQTRRYLSHAEYRFQDKVQLLHIDHQGYQEKIGVIVIADPRSVSKFLHGFEYKREATETHPAHPVHVGELWTKLAHAKAEPKPEKSGSLYRFQEALAMLGFSRAGMRFDRAFLPQDVKEKGFALFSDEKELAGVPEVRYCAAERAKDAKIKATVDRLQKCRIKDMRLEKGEVNAIARHLAKSDRSKIER